ncbi:galactokinase family protein [Actinorugispora endophytica]|uniref:Galactokinase n=1 Tax=Actinorugispora endophytica TaxID=1605990 RepID=A0A4R6UIA7_9ACTN|nr:galactokinase family protein [Actinorugispora endophytica]TDQ45023.1 galactokinase [Actinorugispora endophytica]
MSAMRLFGFGRRPMPRVRDGADGDAAAGAARTAAAFHSAYGADPAGVWWAPHTVPLVGDHVGGGDARVLSAALPWGASAALAPADDGVVDIRSARSPRRPVRFGARRTPGSAPRWAVAADAAVRAALGADAGARVLLDIGPFGLAPEVAAACAVLLAATEVRSGVDAVADRDGLARTARLALDSPSASADPAAALCAARSRAFFLDPRRGRGRLLPLPLDETGLRLLVIDTRTALPDRLAASLRDECARAAAALGVASLRDVDDLAGALAALDDPVLRRRVRHAATETHRANALAGLLRAGATAEAGPVLNASHLSLRDSLADACPRPDTAADTAVRKGARGARMTGSGRLAVALVPTGRLEAVRGGVLDAFAGHRWDPPGFGIAVPSEGARRTL